MSFSIDLDANRLLTAARPSGGSTEIPGRHGTANPRLELAAHQFEASLMQELLKPMQEDPLFGEDKGGDEGGVTGSGGTIRSLGTESMARALSEHGGLGIAQKVMRELNGGGTGRSE